MKIQYSRYYKYTFTPGKILLEELNVLCPKVGFLNNLNGKPNKLRFTKDN